MKTKMYCFSATGNSLAASQKVADSLGETEIVLMAKEMHKTINPKEPRIGLIFPVYVYGIPRIVREFLQKLELSPNQYVFALATCGGTPGTTLSALKKMLKQRGIGLNAGFVISEKSGMLGMENPIIGFIESIAGKPPRTINEKLDDIVAVIRNNGKNDLETSSMSANVVGSALHSMADGMLKKADAAFWVDGNCNLCGMCLRLCPRENIQKVNEKLVWLHNCEQCFACMHWCPQKAIQIGKGTEGKDRYHHPDVKLNQLLLR